MGTELTVIERASVALGASEHEKRLVALAAQSVGIVAITNPASYQECHAARMALKNARVALATLGKDARDDATKFSKAVIAEEARLVGLIEPEEGRLQALQAEHDQREARIKAEREAAEANRIAAIQERMQRDIIDAPTHMVGRPSADIAVTLNDIRAIVIDSFFAEFAPLAEAAKQKAIATLEQLHAGAVAQEKAATEAAEKIKAEKEELAKLRVEAEERKKHDAEEQAKARAAIEEETRAAREKRAEEDRIAAELRAQQEEADRAAREQREALARKIDDEIKAKQEEQRKEQERLDAENRKLRLEQLALADAEQQLRIFKETCGLRDQFSEIVRAIDAYFATPAPKSKSALKRVAAQQG